MADEAYLVSLAVDASDNLSTITTDIAEIKTLLTPDIEGLSSDDSDLVMLDADSASAESVTVPLNFYDDLMAFQWSQTVCMIFILAALLLSLGVQLWLSFSDKWR